MTGPIRDFPAPPAEFTELLHAAVLGAPSPWRRYMDPRSYPAVSRAHTDRWAQLLWEQAWTAGVAWGMARTQTRYVFRKEDFPGLLPPEIGNAT